jgi:hypothetical protein
MSNQFLPKLNLKHLQDIEDYKKVHENDFSQVYFKPDASNIKSEKVGVYIKDMNNQDRVTPFKRMTGLHTEESCKLNAAVVANSQIDYKSSTDYKPGLRYTIVTGDFGGSSNYFLSEAPLREETVVPSDFKGASAGTSVEVRGYIAAQKPGSYRIDLRNKKPPKNVLIWIGNNALKTYRKENAIFVVDDYVIKTEKKTKLVLGEYTPFRMQYTGGDTDLSVLNLIYNNENYPIEVFGTNDSENNLFFYSLTPTTQPSYYDCNIYKGTGLELNNTSEEVQQVIKVWSMDLPNETDSVRLDMVGNLCAYNAEFSKIGGPLVQVQNAEAKPFNLVLDDTLPTPLYITNGTSKTNVTLDDITTVTVPNDKWKRLGVKKSLSNASASQGVNKVISVDKITETVPMISENFKFKVQIMQDPVGKKMLVLLASVADNRIFYTVDPDIKTNKLFYASTFANNKYLKEVPPELKDYTNSTSYSVYTESYPDPDNGFETVDCAGAKNKNYYYKVVDSTNGERCLQPTRTGTNPMFLPKHPGSQYTASTLYMKNPSIRTSDAAKNIAYNRTNYISNGFDHQIELGFKSYPVEKDPLSESDVPGTEGTSYVAELINQVNISTSGKPKIYNPIEMKPMIAGKKIENFEGPTFEGLTINEQSLKTLDTIGANLKRYTEYQNTVNSNHTNIGAKIGSIDTLYTEMSGNNAKYDFTSKTISSLKEDRGLQAALTKDNAIYLAEQNNLYLVGTLTMATLLITAIFVSK